ncbi:MAG: hypothetical protein ACP5N7_00510 [Candidatus Pacearchaeota archaeon]
MKNINLVIGCLHSPFHNKKVWNGILKLIKDLNKNLNGIYLIGDILDLNSLSFHEKGKYPVEIDGEALTIQKEYKMIKVFDELDAVLKRGINKKFLYGNHEARHLRHKEIPDNDKIIIESPEERFRLRERGYEVKTNWKDDYYVIGDHLETFHGSLLGVNPAKRQLDKLKRSCMFAHSHRAGVHFDGNMGSYNIGCLVDINQPVFNYADRLTKRNWMTGFALVTIDDNGFYHAQLITAYNGIFFYNGKKY